MEKNTSTEKHKLEYHVQTEYNRWGAALNIQFGKPVKLPNLKRTILNTSRQELQQRQKNMISIKKNKQSNQNQKEIFVRFTSQPNNKAEEESSNFLPKISQKLMKKIQKERLQRIKSEQKIMKPNFEIIGSYRIGGIIGKGSYATVRLAKGWKGGSFAMKIYDRNKLNDPSQRKNIQNQIEILEKISHPNIIKYYETIDTLESINIVMQLVQNNSLVQFLRSQKSKKATEEDAKVIIRDLLKALAYLQTKNIIHRDIKLENILLSKQMKVKLIDFGFSTFDNQIHYDFCGTLHYISPQIISKGGYLGHSADIWAVGIVMYKLLTGTFPFKGMNEKILCRKICRGQYAQATNVSSEGRELIREMLKLDANDRPSAGQILKNSQWLNENKYMD